ncbi:uncharacterized protein LOC124664967 [Lolium rigidum]|uniref:uncharacterized protein LOC124664967 n=1 Tax=Lolium rigidum TaxID=89674 RepID=UPI001F5D4342|nr:uncharacterized protein LOC124664967 [Lolium rigidum]
MSRCFLHVDKKGRRLESHPCHEGNTAYHNIEEEFEKRSRTRLRFEVPFWTSKAEAMSMDMAVLAHELGHLKCDHGVWLTFTNIWTTGAYTVPGFGMVAGFLEEQLFRWLRATELTCDRAALLVVKDPMVVMSFLMKLAGGCPSLADQLNVYAFLEQARSYNKASLNPVGCYIRNAQTRELSHPLPVMRAREVDEWSSSQEYRTLSRNMFQ